MTTNNADRRYAALLAARGGDAGCTCYHRPQSPGDHSLACPSGPAALTYRAGSAPHRFMSNGIIVNGAAGHRCSECGGQPDEPQHSDRSLPVLTIDAGDWKCSCGNEPTRSGFYPSDATGREQSPDIGGPWDDSTYVCAQCGAVYKGAADVDQTAGRHSLTGTRGAFVELDDTQTCSDHDVPDTAEHRYHEHDHRNAYTTASVDIDRDDDDL